ncbi:conserved Plasmodium protein, unknown function [Plasmodium knowlesi strain H]|uniref:RNA-binding protein n=3 Tax=Plasmodium knowlesi TaxID=5850 RepID=A0A5K1U1H3_PLAKH|nr:RNA-binding protein, putative [Plasmodium knowlesi strain H]OTN65191.1 Uncharacterized protein PKNOH_S120149000 [Plasmodium knowlesi]CAA9988347.1 RNA-binding protein, putative [Plasmodium knowlesi strain H]SBO20085.1 conserved Plasmodium protein, unknown function [Plasmodium knowlesi strain H]SBO20303.1 conserved Plasmodium protein, unknown function [Plasmodium knowlesi strain H]VVS77821.1 RNA-binding protein, putative [Plasmodium knowlesi strain H]|eukprot:XP_002259327.1 hypothetical protein, conserved in Plasmodium species [Plasmodium knowlesi strain H]
MRSDIGVNTPLSDDHEDTENQVNDIVPLRKHFKNIEKLKISSVSTGVDSHRSSAKSSSSQMNLGDAIPYASRSLSKNYIERGDVLETITNKERGEQEDQSTETNKKVNYKINVFSLGEYHFERDNLEGQLTSGRHPNHETSILGNNITDDFPSIIDSASKSNKDKLLFNNAQNSSTSHIEENYTNTWDDDNIFPCEYNLKQFGIDIYSEIEASFCGLHGGETFMEEGEKSILWKDKRNDILNVTNKQSLIENRSDTRQQDNLIKWGDKEGVEENKLGSCTRGINKVGRNRGANLDWGTIYAENALAEMTLSPDATPVDLLTSFFPPPGRSHVIRREVATGARTHVGKFAPPLRDEILQKALNENYYYDLRTNQVWIPGEDKKENILGASEGEGSSSREEAADGTTLLGGSTPVVPSTGIIKDHGFSLPFDILPNGGEVANGFHGERRTSKFEDTNKKMMEDALFTKGAQKSPFIDGHALLPFYAHHGNPPVQEKETPQRAVFTDEKEDYMQYLLGEYFILDQLGVHHREEEMATGRIDNGGKQSVSPNCVQFERHLRENYEEDDPALDTCDNWRKAQMGNNTILPRMTDLKERLLHPQRNRFELPACETHEVDLTNSINIGGGKKWGEKGKDDEVGHSSHFPYPISGQYDDHQQNVYEDQNFNIGSEIRSYDCSSGNLLLKYVMEQGKKKKNKNKTVQDDGFPSSSDHVLPQDCDNHKGENNLLSKRLSKSFAKYTLIVNVPSNTTRKDLLAVFSKFGNVDLTMVVCDKKSRHPNKEWTATSGYAFVRFSTNLEAQRTLNTACAGGIRIRGSRVRATWAKKDSYSKKEKEITFKIPSSILLINIEEFICSICKTNLSYEPILFPCCYASSCSDCLRGYLSVHAVGENIECPNCSLHLSDGLIKIDEHSSGVMGLLYKIHLNVKIKCQNENCKWVGSQNQYVNHFFSCKFGLS